MFPKVAKFQSTIVLAGTGAAAVQAVRGEASPQQRGLWLAGAALLLANLPWTLVKLMPVNKVIVDAGAQGKAAPKEQLEAWGPLHNVRTALGTASALVMGYAVWKL
ncbi:hypothetical protein HYH03_005987 [Edaphochlamys debaryana]|uniref:DUF1772-domain-containing protein n=1 Tax=Edaphochlamys debaryana TaxID=47281 RepID=A0A835Y4Z0_9CHLO|nr:hypothetical protein HYH03_005987 [Edaphochlamys debaryana]|eukprot:KAG2496068.1 hypothetical protein HYH03_005987 [Edaphochlamys debaryana]